MTDAGPPTVITDIRIPFWRLTLFLIKLSLAAIPATIVVFAILFVVAAILSLIFGMPMGMWRRGGMNL
jgi:hypothetical protein